MKPRYQTMLISSFLNQYKNALLLLNNFDLYSFKLHYCVALSFTGSPLSYVCVHPASVALLILNLPKIYGYSFFFFLLFIMLLRTLSLCLCLYLFTFICLCVCLYLLILCHFIFISIHFLVFFYPFFYFLSDVVK